MVDALSRWHSLHAISTMQPVWIQEVISNYDGDDYAQKGIAKCMLNSNKNRDMVF